MHMKVFIFCVSLQFLTFLDSTTATFAEDCLQRHNYYRAMHADTQPLTLDETIQDYAQVWANYLANITSTKHRPTPRKYGENIFQTPGKKANANAAVDRWYSEYKKFNWSNIGYSDRTGHFTQVIWRGSKRLGCAGAIGKYGLFVVANYQPHGNFHPFFRPNLRPPIETTSQEPVNTTENIANKRDIDKVPYILRIFELLSEPKAIVSNHNQRIESWKQILARNQSLPLQTADKDLVLIKHYFDMKMKNNDTIQTIIENIYAVGPNLAGILESLLNIAAGLTLSPDSDPKLREMEKMFKEYSFTNSTVNTLMENLTKELLKDSNINTRNITKEPVLTSTKQADITPKLTTYETYEALQTTFATDVSRKSTKKTVLTTIKPIITTLKPITSPYETTQIFTELVRKTIIMPKLIEPIVTSKLSFEPTVSAQSIAPIENSKEITFDVRYDGSNSELVYSETATAELIETFETSEPYFTDWFESTAYAPNIESAIGKSNEITSELGYDGSNIMPEQIEPIETPGPNIPDWLERMVSTQSIETVIEKSNEIMPDAEGGGSIWELMKQTGQDINENFKGSRYG